MRLPSTNQAQHIAVSADGSTVYFVEGDDRNTRLRTVDAVTMTVDPTPIALAPTGRMAVDPSGNVVIDNGDGVDDYKVIDPTTGQRVGSGHVALDVGDFAIVGDILWTIEDRTGVSDRLVEFTTEERVQQDIFNVDEADKLVVSQDGERGYVLSGRTVSSISPSEPPEEPDGALSV